MGIHYNHLVDMILMSTHNIGFEIELYLGFYHSLLFRGAKSVAQSVGCKTGEQESLGRSTAQPIFLPRIEWNHCNRINSSFIAVHCFDNGYVGKQPVVKMALITTQSIPGMS